MSSINLKNNFALVDCNNFYVSCERLFRPDLIDKAMVVLSSNDGNIIARSNEAKALGVKMGEPYFKIAPFLKKHQVQVFSSNYTLYGDMSRRVMAILQQLEPEVEIYSIDEAFISLPINPNFDLNNHGRHIRRITRKWTGIPVSIGFGPTRTLAKIANHIAKKNPEHHGSFDLTGEKDINRLLARVRVKDIWGIGNRSAAKLTGAGIFTAHDLKRADDNWLRKTLSVTGLRTAWELRGIPCISIDQAPATKKSITCSRSFGHPVTGLSELKEAMATFTARAGEKLRQQQTHTSSLQVFLATNYFQKDKPQYFPAITVKLPTATASTASLLKYAMIALKKIYRPGYEFKKGGITLTGLCRAGSRQLDLFQPDQNDNKLMAALDRINRKWGQDTVHYAATGMEKNWIGKQEHLSSSCTTRWHQLPEVRASLALNDNR